jgi:DNA/RNA-binding domain of Phe-tRNA-synthetase-like protein
MDRIRGTVTMRLGLPGEAYQGIRKDDVHLEGRLTLADDDGPFGNPTSDSARTMVTGETTRALVVVFAPRALGPTAGNEAAELTRDRVGRFAVVSS